MAMTSGEMALELASLGASIGAMLRRGNGQPMVAPTGGAALATGPGFFASLGSLFTKIWQESGASLQDEMEILEAMYTDPTSKTPKLTKDEHAKVAAVLGNMSKASQRIFRTVLMLMDPEFGTIEYAEIKDASGKVTQPASKKSERTGYDPRISALRGIADEVKDDLSNAKEVAEGLKNLGILGRDNIALKCLIEGMGYLSKGLRAVFDVETIEEITLNMIKEKFSTALTPSIDLPPTDNAGWLVRFMRSITPGAYTALSEEERATAMAVRDAARETATAAGFAAKAKTAVVLKSAAVAKAHVEVAESALRVGNAKAERAKAPRAAKSSFNAAIDAATAIADSAVANAATIDVELVALQTEAANTAQAATVARDTLRLAEVAHKTAKDRAAADSLVRSKKNARRGNFAAVIVALAVILAILIPHGMDWFDSVQHSGNHELAKAYKPTETSAIVPAK